MVPPSSEQSNPDSRRLKVGEFVDVQVSGRWYRHVQVIATTLEGMPVVDRAGVGMKPKGASYVVQSRLDWRFSASAPSA